MSKNEKGGQTMEELMVSMMRFSTAMTLFGMEQLQASMKMMGGQENFNDSVERMREAMDNLADAVVGKMDPKKKETVDSVAQASRDAVAETMSAFTQTMEGVNLGGMDPAGAWQTTSDMVWKTSSDLMKASSDMIKGTSESVTGWMGGQASEAGASEPKPAAEALSKGRAKKTAATK
jgi:hypothetical protein